MAGKRRPQELVPIPFRFTTARQMAAWCGVTLGTAVNWRNGHGKASVTAQRLIGLYRDERVLTGSWEGFSVRGEDLVDPHGNCVNRKHLLAYVLIIQHAAELARQAGPEAQERHYQLLGKTG